MGETFTKNFETLVLNLDLTVPSNLHYQILGNGNDVLTTVSKYQSNPSIKTIIKKKISFFKREYLTDVQKGKKKKRVQTGIKYPTDLIYRRNS